MAEARRRTPWVVAVAAAMVALAGALRFGGALEATTLPEEGAEPGLVPAGSLLKGLVPITELAMTAAATLTVGLLLVVVVFLPSERGRLSALGARCLRAAAVGAAGWALTALTVAVLSVADLMAVPVGRALAGPELVSYLTDLPQGRASLVVVVVAALLTLTCGLPRTPAGAGYLLVLAVAGLLPPVFTGHAAGAGDHSLAVFSLAVHVVAVTAWVGGLLVLVAVAGPLGGRLGEVMTRYSGLALVCFAAVGLSGLANAWVRLGGLDVSSRYGALVVAKTVALAVLGGLGWWHRRAGLPALRTGRRGRVFARVAAVELAVMAAAMGLATGLSRTPPPADVPAPADRAELLLGFPMPGPASPRAYALDWWIDPMFLTLVVGGAGLYLAGVVRLRRGGVAWPVLRTVAWLSGLLIVLIATCGGLSRYSMVLFSAHMVQHMALSMLAPILLLLGAPVTLALRALPTGGAAGRTPRQLLLAVLHSRATKVLSHPLVALAMFVVSLYGFYFSPLFEASMRNHWLHSLTMLHFVVTGALYFWSIIGVDPGPHRLTPVLRFLLMMVVMPFHAFFGIGFMMTRGVFAAGWYEALGRPWGASPLHDQQVGGGLAWSFGEIATLLVMVALAVQWFRGDQREARRLDRRADRAVSRGRPDELASYNAHLARLARGERP